MDWQKIVLSETDSTNRYVKELAAAGAPEGTVVIANKQSAGRGRLGRSFFSPEEKGIYMSILLRPDIELSKAVLITSMAAVAVARAIEQVSGIPAQIKWVNDIFLNKKKVCGILTEAGIDAERQKLDYAVLGIGVNVGTMEFPEELKEIATSVSNEYGFAVSKEELVDEILKELEIWYPTLWNGGFLEENKKRSILLGKEILVLDETAPGGSYAAKAVDINELGNLIIDRDGTTKVLNSGEVSIRF
ncbi:MAG: biotin--[Lachnospiraceae bacterium]|nr:biotin--[acetyl-CoA-carboxylase] ligase [Lachnospiraceae bacterium]